MIAALDRKCYLKASVGLQEPVESVTVADRHLRRCAEVISGISRRIAGPNPGAYVVAVYLVRIQNWRRAPSQK